MKTEINNQTNCNRDFNANSDACKLLHSVIEDVTAHSAHTKKIIQTLKEAAEGDENISILGERRMRSHAINCGLRNVKKKELNEVAIELSDVLLADISRTESSIYNEVLEVVVPPERQMLWKQLGLLPVGSDQAVSDAMQLMADSGQNDLSETMNSALRLGAAFILNSTAGPSIASECLCGSVERITTKVQLNSLQTDAVNIALYEHIPTLASVVLNTARSEKYLALANEAGAKNIQLYTVQSSSASSSDSAPEILPLATPNGVGIALATGAIDVLLTDTQKVLPKVAPVAACYKTVIVTTNKSSHLPDAEYIGADVDLSDCSELEKLAERIVKRAIESFKARKEVARIVPAKEITAQVGFTLNTVDRHYGCLDRIASALIEGKINGIVSLSGCVASDPQVMESLAPLVDTLLKNNILIFTNGCAAFSMAIQGYCSSKAQNKCGERLQQFLDANLPPVWHFGECNDNAQSLATFREIAKYAGHKMKDLPFAAIIPEWSCNKGIGATFAFRMSGFDTYFCSQTSQLESEEVQTFLHEEVKDLLGSSMHVISTSDELVEKILSQFAAIRSELCWR